MQHDDGYFPAGTAAKNVGDWYLFQFPSVDDRNGLRRR